VHGAGLRIRKGGHLLQDTPEPRFLDAADLGLAARGADGRVRPAPGPRKFRWWLFRVFETLGRLTAFRGRPGGLVAVRMDGIGDMVLFRQSLEYYAEAFGVEADEITILGCHAWKGLAPHVFEEYHVHTIDEHRYHRNPFYRFLVARWLRGRNFQIAVCDMHFRKPLMADSLLILAGAERTVAAVPHLSPKTNDVFAYYLSRCDQLVDTGPYPTHEALRHYRFVSAVLGRNVEPAPIAIPWRDVRPPVPRGAPYVVLNFGSNEYGRRWPFDGYLSVARRLLDQGYRVVFCGAANDQDHKCLIREALGDTGVVDLIGATTVSTLFDLLKHAAGLLTNDTGPAHLGISQGIPTLVLVGGGHFGCFVPYPDALCPPTAKFLHHEMDCYHCFWNCPKRANDRESFPCVAAIPEDTVWETFSALLDGAKAG